MTIPPDVTYPNQVAALMGDRFTSINDGVGGQTLVQMQSDAATQIDAIFYNPQRSLLMWWGGTNDLFGGATAATVLSRSQTYYDARKAIGWRLVEIGILPRTQSGLPANFETSRQTIRTAKLAIYTTATSATNVWKNADGNFYVDIGADTTIGTNGNQSNLTYYLDGVHLTSAGYAIIAAYVQSAILLFP